MFVNGEALARALWLVPTLAAVFLAASVAHLVWIVRFARSPFLRAQSSPAHVLLVALALATPIVSFYAVEIAGWWRHRNPEATRRDARLLVVAAMLTLTAAAAASVYDVTRYVPQDRTLHAAADTFVKLVRLLVVAQVTLAMVVRVFVRRGGLVWGWAVLSAASAAILLLAV